MNALSFYGDVDFPTGTGLRDNIHNISSLATLLSQEYQGISTPPVICDELMKSPLPKWIVYMQIQPKEDISHAPMQFMANVYDFSRMILHHLGVDITPDEGTVRAYGPGTEGILLPTTIVKNQRIRTSSLKLATGVVVNFFTLGKYHLAVSVVNKLLMLIYDLIEAGIPGLHPDVMEFFLAVATQVVKYWRVTELAYPRDIEQNPTGRPPIADVWTSQKDGKKKGVCMHMLLRARQNGRCFLSQVQSLQACACD
jgi:hypothetical protein